METTELAIVIPVVAGLFTVLMVVSSPVNRAIVKAKSLLKR